MNTFYFIGIAVALISQRIMLATVGVKPSEVKTTLHVQAALTSLLSWAAVASYGITALTFFIGNRRIRRLLRTKKIALIGRAAAGKDTVKGRLIKLGFTPEVSYTTRPPRSGEVHGTSYHFCTEDEFHAIDMIEKVNFNGWWYGTARAEFDRCNLFIFTPSGLALLPPERRKELTVVYLTVDKVTQRGRLVTRGDANDSLDRRMEADERDFAEFDDWDLKISTAVRDEDEVMDTLLERLTFPSREQKCF